MRVAAVALAVVAGSSQALAQGAAKPDPAKAREIVNQVCAACHGPDGNSASPTNPHLAGQHADYITKQLADFKQNKERKSPVMMGMTGNLSPEDIKGVASYFAQQKPKPGSARDKELAAFGQKIYRGGVGATGVPACAACHAPNGAGVPAQFPRLAGQFADYTLAQLKAFASEERANDPNRMMRTIAARMTEKEMRAVAEYIAGLR